MGIALDLSVLLVIAVLGPALLAAFELETPGALLLPVLGGVAGVAAHFVELRGWTWPE